MSGQKIPAQRVEFQRPVMGVLIRDGFYVALHYTRDEIIYALDKIKPDWKRSRLKIKPGRAKLKALRDLDGYLADNPHWTRRQRTEPQDRPNHEMAQLRGKHG